MSFAVLYMYRSEHNKDGRSYFYNANTQESLWEKPKVLIDWDAQQAQGGPHMGYPGPNGEYPSAESEWKPPGTEGTDPIPMHSEYDDTVPPGHLDTPIPGVAREDESMLPNGHTESTPLPAVPELEEHEQQPEQDHPATPMIIQEPHEILQQQNLTMTEPQSQEKPEQVRTKY